VSQSEPKSPNPVSDASNGSAPVEPALWLRILSCIPLPLWYGIASFLAFLAWKVFPHRRHVIEGNLKISFPEWDDATRERVIGDFYSGFADVFVETTRSLRMSRAELDRRMRVVNPELARAETAKGKPVLLLAAHQGNWEWLLLGLSTQLGMPVDAAYKPLRNAWADRAMLAVRSHFGARMIPAQNLLADIIQQRNVPRAIALLSDQEPVGSDRMHWARFLNRDTAFFLGGEQIARSVRYAAYFVKVRRLRRGFYEAELVPLVAAGEQLPPGEFTNRFARLVEEQIRAAPAGWPWSHKRWKLRKPPGA
jgi:Kdo2-lipid IVA lauroyltransferase/acyltransferase